MKANRKVALWMVILSVVWMLAGWGQNVNPLPKRGDQLTVEGELTYLQTIGPAILELKTAEGRAYRIQLPLGIMAELRREGFNPKVGEKVGANGEVVCVLAETPVIAAGEIRFNGKTYRLAPQPS
jgi:hypothetical protein